MEKQLVIWFSNPLRECSGLFGRAAGVVAAYADTHGWRRYSLTDERFAYYGACTPDTDLDHRAAELHAALDAHDALAVQVVLPAAVWLIDPDYEEVAEISLVADEPDSVCWCSGLLPLSSGSRGRVAAVFERLAWDYGWDQYETWQQVCHSAACPAADFEGLMETIHAALRAEQSGTAAVFAEQTLYELGGEELRAYSLHALPPDEDEEVEWPEAEY